jgi:hypothetical protein
LGSTRSKETRTIYTSKESSDKVEVLQFNNEVVVILESNEIKIISWNDNSTKAIHRLQLFEKNYFWNRKEFVQIINDKCFILDDNKFYRYSMSGDSLGVWFAYPGSETIGNLDNHFVFDEESMYVLTIGNAGLLRISHLPEEERKLGYVLVVGVGDYPNNGRGMFLKSGKDYLALCSIFSESLMLVNKDSLEDQKLLKTDTYISRLLNFDEDRLYYLVSENKDYDYVDLSNFKTSNRVTEFKNESSYLININKGDLLTYDEGLILQQLNDPKLKYSYFINSIQHNCLKQ